MSTFSGLLLFLWCLTLRTVHIEAACVLGNDLIPLSDWTGTIETPDFDSGKYPLNQHCTWQVTLSRGSRIRLVFDKFDLDPGINPVSTSESKCQDYVKILDGANGTGQDMGTFCGGTTPPPLVSRSNQITVIFSSDGNGGKQGFKLSYSGNCENVNVTETGSVLESPNYPRPPPDNVRCEWWLSVPDSMSPLVTVADFQTNATKCDDAIVNLYGAFEETNWICRDRVDPIKFNWNKMVIEYTKKAGAPSALFSLDLTFVDKCRDDLCENGGNCEDEMLGVVCKCAKGFHGDRCQLKLMTCADKPCKNGAECIETDEEIVCECTPGFAGETCDVRISECTPNPCLQGGTCVDKTTDYSCVCPDGYTGKNCENLRSACQRNQCQNGGTCQDFRNGFICVCPDDFAGETCQEALSNCNEKTCVHGECQGTPDGAMCECAEGYTGPRCDKDIDDCQMNPCNRGSTCIDEENGYMCLCQPGYTGKRCYGDIFECTENPCQNNGTCENLVPGFRCQCIPGFGGKLCDTDLDECDPNPCEGGARCVDRPGGFECECPPGLTGRKCDTEVNPCLSDPCQNEAPCVAITRDFGADYVCECPLGYDGKQCEEEINECDPNPCQNGGNCRDMVNDFMCQCPRGFRGKRCNITVATCSSRPCRNEADCINNNNGYDCLCKPGFTGRLCETNINECAENPCKNNATCVDHKGFFVCDCVAGFEGKTCDVDINECSPNPCEHDGTCTDLLNDFRCECGITFGGRLCDDFIFKEFEKRKLPTCGGPSCDRYFLASVRLCIDQEDSPHCQDDEDENGIKWFSSRTGSEQARPCPPGIIGYATRNCAQNEQSPSGGAWSDPDLRSCVSPLLLKLSEEAQKLLTDEYVSDRQIAFLAEKVVNATKLQAGSRLYPGDLISAAETIGTVAVAVERATVTPQGLRKLAQIYGDALVNIVDPQTASIWNKVKDVGFVEEKVTDVLDSTELLGENMAAKLSQGYRRRKRGLYDTIEEDTISVIKHDIEFQVKMVETDKIGSGLSYHGQTLSSSITLPTELLTRVSGGQPGTFAVYNGKFSSLSKLLTPRPSPSNRTANGTESGLLNSDVIAAKILGVPDATFHSLTEPVVITFELKDPSLSTAFAPLCSFLNVSARSSSARWPRSGCGLYGKNSTHVTCHCYHLTNFAVLMDVYGITGGLSVVHQRTLSFISYIGGTLSILGCALAIAVFEYFRLKSDRVRIHEHLAISIILVQFIFLVGIDRKENPHVCKVFAVLLHYCLLVMFCWMLVEGIHLYVILVKVFKKGSHLKKYMALGWGVPLIIVAVSVGVFYDDYGQGEMCWMTNFMLLVLFVPIATVVILLNVFVLVVVVRVMMKSFAITGKTNSEEASSLRITLKAAAVLLPLLGLTWSFCFLSFDTQATLLFTYLFTLFNCLQGVLFFVFHCLLNIDVRKAYERRYKRPKQTSVNNPTGDRHTGSRRKGSLMTTECDPFVDSGPYNGSSLSYRSSTKSDDTEFSDLSYYSKQSGGSQGRINNLSSTVPETVYRPDNNTAESYLSQLPKPT